MNRPTSQSKVTLNPYQWITPISSDAGESHSKLAMAWDTARHDVYLPSRRSGRLICKLETLSPLVIGNKQTERGEQPALLEPFVDQATENFAVPGSSLRGLISSVAESISGSALRVLTNSTLTRRQLSEQGMNQLGKLIYKDDNWYLQPLGRVSRDEVSYSTDIEKIRNLKTITKVKRELLSDQHETRSVTFPDDHGTLYGCYTDARKGEFPEGSHKYVLWIPSAAHWPNVSPLAVNTSLIENFIKLLHDRIVNRRKKEQNDPFVSPPFIPVGYEKDFPYDLAEKNPGTFEENLLSWLDGKIVYYKQQNNSPVTNIAFSAIWRELFEVGEGKHHVHDSYHPQLLPWGTPARQGDNLSPAEALFGVIEDTERNPDRQKPAKLLAGRVRFADALPASPLKPRQIQPSYFVHCHPRNLHHQPCIFSTLMAHTRLVAEKPIYHSYQRISGNEIPTQRPRPT